MHNSDQLNQWREDLSQEFIVYGRYFVPERERQMEMIVALLPEMEPGATILKLCCGEGLLSDGGVFLIADIIDPVHPQSKKLAAEAYDEIVLARSLKIDGDTQAFDFFDREGWNIFRYLDPDDIDKPSSLYDQLQWLEQAGFRDVDVFWMQAGHAIFGGWR